MGRASSALSGATTGASLGSFIPGIGTAIGAGIGGLGGFLFGGGGDEKDKQPKPDDPNALLQANADRLHDKSLDLSAKGSDTLSPVLAYFKKLMGDDPSAILEATGPERGRVIDQYDTARKAVSQFAPRGGGASQAIGQSYFSEANQLSDITSSARRDAFGASANLGTTLTGLGLSADQLESADLTTIINALLTKRGQNAGAWAGGAEALGTILGLVLTRGSGGGGGGGGSASPSVPITGI